MAGSSRRFALAVILLPLLVLVMAGVSRATVFTVNSLSGEPATPAACSLVDAIAAANGTTNVCGTKTGSDTIVFALSGTIVIDEPLLITDADLTIQGRLDSPVIIDGDGVTQIIDHESGDLQLNNLTFQNGFADSMLGFEGAAVLANSSGTLGINGDTFTHNFAVTGGAVFGGAGTVVIINSTFANNTADTTSDGGGGAIFNFDSDMFITNCTFFQNDAPLDSGGSLAWQIGAAPFINSSILVAVPTDDSDNCQAPGDVPGIVNDGGFNISDDETCFTGLTTSKINTPLNLDATGLENNGGPTQTVLPETNSPAIDFVPIGSCLDFSLAPVTIDQRLFGRPDFEGGIAESFCDAGAVETGSVADIVLTPHSERVQIARSGSPNSDEVNIGLTFTINDSTGCDPGEDALNAGFSLSLYESTCAALPLNGLMLSLNPFVVHTVNHQSYGTLFQMSPPDTLQQPTETVSARLVALHTPPAPACGSWTLNLEVAGVNTNSLGLGGGNPFALVLTDSDGHTGCFDVTNAIVGNQLPTPPQHHPAVRRRTRRR
jgi:hypothetical protein